MAKRKAARLADAASQQTLEFDPADPADRAGPDATHDSPRLGLEPVIRSEAELDESLRVRGFLDSWTKAVEAKAQERIAQVREELRELLYVTVDGQRVAIADRLDALQAAEEAYCTAYRDTLLDGDKKCRELTHGVIGWNIVPGGWTFKNSEAASCAKLDKAYDLIAKATRAVLHKLGLPFVVFRLGISKKALAQAVKDKKTNRTQLRKWGIVKRADRDKFYARPHLVKVSCDREVTADDDAAA